MSSVTLEEAQAKLPELIERLAPGEEILITIQGQPLAHVKKSQPSGRVCRAGSAKDKILWIAEDFDSPLEDFAEYSE